jgi:hypothetical protein
LFVLCVGFTLLLGEDTPTSSLFGALVRSVTKLASITFLSLAFSYWIDYLDFITEGKLAAVLITPSLGVPNWSVINIINTAPSAATSKPVEEDEMISYVLNGLDSSYNDLVSSVNGNPNTTFDELYSLIHAHDPRCGMLAEDKQEPSFISSANTVDRRGHHDRQRGNHGRSPDRGDRLVNRG